MYRVGKTHFTIYKTSLHEQSSGNINHNCVNAYPQQGKCTVLSDSSHLFCSGSGGLPFKGAWNSLHKSWDIGTGEPHSKVPLAVRSWADVCFPLGGVFSFWCSDFLLNATWLNQTENCLCGNCHNLWIYN